MKLSVAQMLLEEGHFSHKGNFLAKEASSASLPGSSVDLAIELAKEADLSTAFVRLRVSTDPEEGYAFLVVYSALFKLTLEGEVPDDLDRRLMVTGATMLFPFVREVVANLTMRGRFGPSWLAPTDFSKVVADTAKLSASDPPDSVSQ